jgi:hypothetical protein
MVGDDGRFQVAGRGRPLVVEEGGSASVDLRLTPGEF